MFIHKKDTIIAIVLGFLWSITIFGFTLKGSQIEQILSPIAMSLQPLQPLKEGKPGKEIFGYLPYWNQNKTASIDFDVLTTLAYFDLKANADGMIIKNDDGYATFKSRAMTNLFKKAHNNGTRVVATVTMMNASEILAFLDNPEAQDRLVKESVDLVKKRGIDGINVDIEYFGGAGPSYQPKFTRFVKNLTTEMHAAVPGSRVSVALYASVARSPRIFDLSSIADSVDQVFMMAYDYTMASSDYAMPTAPLYGYKQGLVWYDVSTAVDEFLQLMPADKLILGNPWYNLNFPVVSPQVKAPTIPGVAGETLTYSADKNIVKPDMEGITDYVSGWDSVMKVSWKAYYRASTGMWRMSFTEDTRAQGEKYDFALSRKLAGVGFWALGNEGESPEVWALLKDKFGIKLTDNTVINKSIREDNI
jgi:chitinase